MKPTLILLIALTLIYSEPAFARRYWLILFSHNESFEKIQMSSKKQCKEQGELWESSKETLGVPTSNLGWACLEGK
tara:strand:- start:312 stop:539 length:228 start_codon:yes stop_codon:yes gene_type:complete